MDACRVLPEVRARGGMCGRYSMSSDASLVVNSRRFCFLCSVLGTGVKYIVMAYIVIGHNYIAFWAQSGCLVQNT